MTLYTLFSTFDSPFLPCVPRNMAPGAQCNPHPVQISVQCFPRRAELYLMANAFPKDAGDAESCMAEN